jgi:dethiobiotin synthetase
LKGRRPERLVVVIGTGTEVGKTWVSARLLAYLHDTGVTVAARKPVQSFDPRDDPAGFDSAVLGAASGERSEVVCLPHRRYEVAMAPPMAAQYLRRPGFTVDDLVTELAWPDDGVGVGLIETVGGVRSPQADDGDAVSLLQALSPDVVLLVADAGLGTINSVRLTIGACSSSTYSGSNVVVALNRYDEANELHVLNRRWLIDRDRLRVVVLPGEEPALASLMRGE